MKYTFDIPEWGKETCVVGSEWKEGEYNGTKFAHTKIYGISRKTVNKGRDEIIVTEEFKFREKVFPTVGKTYVVNFNRYGQVEALIEKGGDTE